MNNKKAKQGRRAQVKNGKGRDAESNGATVSSEKVVVLSLAQRTKIASAQSEAIAVERRIAYLDLEKDNMRALLRQKYAQLQTVCSNTLREHGIDLDDPEAGRWRINPETMEVQRAPVPSQSVFAP